MKRFGKKVANECYYKRPSAYVIIERDEDDKIAIVTDNPNVFFFLGGGIEKGETELEALKREVIEEAGYEIENIKPLDKVCSYCSSGTYGFMDIEASVYTANFGKKIAEPIELDHKLMWVNPKDYANKLYHKYQNYVLNNYIKQRNKRD